jgi:uncharacterized Zn finger protein (UPF0148 family)
MNYKIIIPQEEPKIMHNCPKCGLDLVEREGSKPVCTRIDCGGIIISNETLREWALKEEPKQDLEKEMFELEQELDIPSSMRWHNSKPKQEIDMSKYISGIDPYDTQETLEEVAYNYENSFKESDGTESVDFIEGAKWQAERMYSEEDVMNALHSVELKYNKDFTKIYEGMKEWFEQNKKK